MRHSITTGALLAAALAVLASVPGASADTECYDRVLCVTQDGATWGEGECGDGAYYGESHTLIVTSPMVPGLEARSYNGCAAYDDGSTAYTWSWLYVTGSYYSPVAGFFYANAGWSGGTGATAHCSAYYFTHLSLLGGSGYGRPCNVADALYPEPPVVLPLP